MEESIVFKGASKIGKWTIIIVSSIILIYFISAPADFRRNSFLIVMTLMLISVVLVICYAAWSISLKNRVEVTKEMIIIPGHGKNFVKNQLNCYFMARRGLLTRMYDFSWVFYITRDNVKRAYLSNASELDSQKPKSLLKQDMGVIKLFFASAKDKTVCIEFKQPLKFIRYGLQFGKDSEPLDKVYVSVTEPYKLIETISNTR